jgi:hypothetical protein
MYIYMYTYMYIQIWNIGSIPISGPRKMWITCASRPLTRVYAAAKAALEIKVRHGLVSPGLQGDFHQESNILRNSDNCEYW